MKSLFSVLKVVMLAFYACTVASFFIEPLFEFQTIFVYIVLTLAVLHIGEIIILNKKLAHLPRQKMLLNTMLFGFVYWIPELKQSSTT